MKKYYDATAKFHKKFKMKGTNNEDMTFRLNLLIEELGELAQAVTKGKSRENVLTRIPYGKVCYNRAINNH